jgi:hypothetical protein
MVVITMLLMVHLRAAGCSLDRGELAAFIIRTIFNKEVFILPNPSSRLYFTCEAEPEIYRDYPRPPFL